ncbi:acyl-[acyl-carrier-protein]--UDP-N-acetylglucosamine O-acyltransferase [Rhodobacterales bacterium 52_120_T64]|mgnify:CR=1 FL=1|nr:acyl-[acyl-carrier-protein]--UDP-N-acetylglucosamine O-acyltransferase [Rhodobacterales bacterium 52_120_T64]
MSIDATATIHPSAVIEDGAVIGANCKIGPFCLVGPNVTLGESVVLFSHVVVAGFTNIGDKTRIWPTASIGHQPQDLKYAGERTYLEIGASCMIREGVTVNPGTAGGTGVTRVGDNCLLMLGAHIGHDAQVGNNVVLANHASVAGHVTIGENVIIGALSGVHQFVKVGKGAIIGGLAAVVADVIPYGMALSERANLGGLNLIGLKRRGVDKTTINGLRASFSEIFEGEGTLKERAQKAQDRHSDNELVSDVVDFLLADSARSFLLPKSDD